jgi:alpha-L-arabinofuranosidase
MIDDGLLAELLHDRKFEEGDRDGNGVSAAWVPEERVHDRYWELRDGRGVNDRYSIDHNVFYGGGASQQIQITGPGSNHASVYQIGLQLAKDRRYAFYVYLRKNGAGTGFVEFDKLGGPNYFHKDFEIATEGWGKYTAEFTAPENTSEARARIGFVGTGTFWIDSASLMPADNVDGIRRDVIEALRPIHVSVLRYPGGCYADYYNWKNGIGPRDKRPDKWSTVWHEWNSNDFGTDEYMELAQTLGYDGHITVNYSSGTAQDAAEWVQYANGSAETAMGHRRAQNGHPEPYGIKLWAIGNEAPNLCSEQYTGGTKLEDYGRRFNEYAAAMRKVDPSIQIFASSVGQPGWVRQVLESIPTKHIFLAENCSLINVQGLVEVNPVDIKLTPPYFAYMLYANHIGSEVMQTEVTVPPVSFDPKLPALEAIATRSPDGHKLYIAVVNRALNEAVATQINLKGWQPAGNPAQVYELNGKTWDAFNPYGSTDNVNISQRTVEITQSEFSYLFPPHTATVVEVSGSPVPTH